MGVVAFDYAAWIARYPEFSTITQATATLMFDEAGLYLTNSDAGPVPDETKRRTLLNMATAHIAGLSRQDLVGRITDTTQGSVSLSASFADSVPGTAAWFLQTPYGASFWQATAYLRTMRYIPRPACAAPFRRW